MTIAEAFSGTNGTWGTEYSLTNGSTTIAAQTTKGQYQVWLDLNALANGDQYELRIYDKCRSGDAQRCGSCSIISNAQGVDNALGIGIPVLLFWGWDFSLKRVAGSDRTILWSVRALT